MMETKQVEPTSRNADDNMQYRETIRDLVRICGGGIHAALVLERMVGQPEIFTVLTVQERRQRVVNIFSDLDQFHQSLDPSTGRAEI